jgi:hypothetical protein
MIRWLTRRCIHTSPFLQVNHFPPPPTPQKSKRDLLQTESRQGATDPKGTENRHPRLQPKNVKMLLTKVFLQLALLFDSTNVDDKKLTVADFIYVAKALETHSQIANLTWYKLYPRISKGHRILTRHSRLPDKMVSVWHLSVNLRFSVISVLLGQWRDMVKNGHGELQSVTEAFSQSN